MAGIRCFVALPTPPAAQSQITALIQNLQSVSSDVKWEAPEKVHLTLRFLGNVEMNLVEELSRQLADRVRYLPAFEMTYDGLGAFPNWTRPRVVWIGIRSGESLDALQRNVEDVVTGLGLKKEEREFHPHVTIGRVKGFRHLDLLTARVKSLTLSPVLTLCNTVLVVKSELHPAGSKYTVIQSIPLSS